MIGFVEVDIKYIKKAYSFIKNYDNEETISKNEKISEKLEKVNDIMKVSTGRKGFFNKKQRIKLKSLLEELVYSSYISSNEYIILRTELAGLIQDIIYLYEDVHNNNEDSPDNENR
ncbi:hypothetical protein PBI_SCTP2_182 [Salicola phage SCTP-2]|nr:hypothetical protein PBI_SCTP2_182 [Salicola phage SCTP-2]